MAGTGIIQKKLSENKAVVAQKKSAVDVLQSQRFSEQVKKALPKTMNTESFIRSAITEFRLNPTLQQASIASVCGYFLQVAALGLKPATVLGHCYAVPFRNNKTGEIEAQFILGYRGMLALARRSGEVSSVECNIVHEKDEFKWTWEGDGLVRYLKETNDPDPGPMIAVYCIVRFRDGGYQGIKMSKAKVDSVRRRSKASGNGPWVTDYEEMAKKTCFRNLFKWLPINIDTQELIEKDNTVVRWDGEKDDDDLEITFVNENANDGVVTDQEVSVDPDTGEVTPAPAEGTESK